MAGTSTDKGRERVRPHARAATRFLFGAVAGIIIAALLPGRPPLAVRLVAGWDTGALLFLAQAWLLILGSDARRTRRRAAADDPGRLVVLTLVLVASVVSLVAGLWLLRNPGSAAPRHAGLLFALAIGAVLSAWLVAHTAFTLHYAHLYYRDDGRPGGLGFPGDGDPADLDFAYFAFTIGMAFQVSDVAVTFPELRRVVLGHALLSFLFNTGILALALNLAFSRVG